MNKKKRLISILFILLIFISTRFSLSYLMTSSTNSNTFIEGTVKATVLETVDKQAKTKEDIKVKNEGNVDIFVRVNIVYNFNDENNSLIGITPTLNEDYSVSFPESNWIKDEEDNFYYYKYPLAPNETTDVLIDELKILYDGNDKHVVVNIIAEGIQANPKTSVSELWNKSVSNDTIVIGS